MSAGDGDGAGGPEPHPRTTSGDESVLARLWHAESGPLFVLREVLTSVATVAAVGILLFAVSGVWPPMVAVESGSMEPHMHKGDLVFITEPGRYAPDASTHAGVLPYQEATALEYRQFGSYGSVVVYAEPGESGPPVIHRARFWVEKGENWYPRANPDYVGSAEGCDDIATCPAPHAGFMTKGDANDAYDQVNGLAQPVRPAWVVGTARVRVPWLGWIRLLVSGSAGVVVEPGSPVSAMALTVG